MIGADESMPIFTASAPKSVRTASICARTNAGGTSWTPCTPTEFCAVRAVSTDMPNTRNAENVLRSAWMPAPPPESEPAIVSAFATVIDLGSIRRDHDHELAAHLARAQPLQVHGGRRGDDLLELFGELPGHDDRRLAEDLGDGLERGDDPVRRLVDRSEEQTSELQSHS